MKFFLLFLVIALLSLIGTTTAYCISDSSCSFRCSGLARGTCEWVGATHECVCR